MYAIDELVKTGLELDICFDNETKKIQVGFKNAFINIDDNIISVRGCGATVENAAKDYIAKIKGCILVINPSEDHKEIMMI